MTFVRTETSVRLLHRAAVMDRMCTATVRLPCETDCGSRRGTASRTATVSVLTRTLPPVSMEHQPDLVLIFVRRPFTSTLLRPAPSCISCFTTVVGRRVEPLSVGLAVAGLLHGGMLSRGHISCLGAI